MADIVENKSKRLNYTLLTEKYRPETIKDMVLSDKLKTQFDTIIKNKDIPNMLFHSSSPGVGKTTAAKALAKECDFDCIYINNSLDRGIDTLRSRIVKFASSLSFDGKKKVVILDEFDGTTPELQKALRASIEEFHDSCRFICTCNYLSKIMEPLQSRLQLIDFNFSDYETKKVVMKEMGRRLVTIIEAENIKYDSKHTIAKILKAFYPDLRKMLILIQQCNSQYGMINENIFKIENLDEEFYKLILNKKFTNARKYVADNNVNLEEIYTLLKTNLLDSKMIEDKSIRGNLYIILNEYDYKSSFVVDKDLNFAACMMEMFKEM